MHQGHSASPSQIGEPSPKQEQPDVSLPIDRSILELAAKLAEIEKQHREGQAAGASLAARARRLELLRSVRDCDDVQVAREALFGAEIPMWWFHAIADCPCPNFMAAMLDKVPESQRPEAARLLVYGVVKAAERGRWSEEQVALVESARRYWESNPFVKVHMALAQGQKMDIDMGADHTSYNQQCILSLQGEAVEIGLMRRLLGWALSPLAATFVNDEDFSSNYRIGLLRRDSVRDASQEDFWSYDPKRERRPSVSADPYDSLMFGFDLGVLLVGAEKAMERELNLLTESLEERELKFDLITSTELELYGSGEWLGDRLRRCQDLLIMTGDDATSPQAEVVVHAWTAQVRGERSEWLRQVYKVSSRSDVDRALAERRGGIRSVPDSYLAWHYGVREPKSNGVRE